MKPNLSDSAVSNGMMRLMAAGTIALLFNCGFIAQAWAESKFTDQKKADQAAVGTAGSETGIGFKQLDANGDKNISLKEAVKDKMLANVFDTVDIDHDGMISADEYADYTATLSDMSKDRASMTY